MDAAEAVSGTVVLPIQFFAGPTSDAWTPERRLMAAVLEEAVRECRTVLDARGAHAQFARRALSIWFCSENEDGPFSFVSICHALDLEPSGVRAALAPRPWATPSRRP